MNKIKVRAGLVIADDNEFAPISRIAAKLGGTKMDKSFFGNDVYRITVSGETVDIAVYAVLCGIGKVNAAAATTALIANGSSFIINSGLSGGINNVFKGETVLCDRFIEHDFDVTPLGYKKYEKPGQAYIYNANAKLLRAYKSLYPNMKVGTAVTGDCFVCDDNLRKTLTNELNAQSCDMESAAVAAICDKCDIPFVALRLISDNAGAGAQDEYSASKGAVEASLLDTVFAGFAQIANLDESNWRVN